MSNIISRIKFQMMTDDNKRRMIARDVILQVGIGKYMPRSVYFRDNYDGNCTVCGIGACMVSLARHSGKSISYIRAHHHLERFKYWNELEKFFGVDQLALIEEFFEKSHTPTTQTIGGKFEICVTPDQCLNIAAAKKLFAPLTQEECMIKIMENIVRNGKFDVAEELEFDSKHHIGMEQQSELSVGHDAINFHEAVKNFQERDNQTAQNSSQMQNNH